MLFVRDSMKTFTVVCDGQAIGRATLPPVNADDYTKGDLDPFPAFERVRLILTNAMLARIEAHDLCTDAERAGKLPMFEPPPPLPGESTLTLYDLDPSVLDFVGRERLEAMAAEDALEFGLLDDSGQPVAGVEVTVRVHECPGYPAVSPGPPHVMVLSGIWVKEDSDPKTPPSRPEA